MNKQEEDCIYLENIRRASKYCKFWKKCIENDIFTNHLFNHGDISKEESDAILSDKLTMVNLKMEKLEKLVGRAIVNYDNEEFKIELLEHIDFINGFIKKPEDNNYEKNLCL